MTQIRHQLSRRLQAAINGEIETLEIEPREGLEDRWRPILIGLSQHRGTQVNSTPKSWIHRSHFDSDVLFLADGAKFATYLSEVVQRAWAIFRSNLTYGPCLPVQLAEYGYCNGQFLFPFSITSKAARNSRDCQLTL